MIRSGGQSGVDRAALDTAGEFGISMGGWCPKGGWAEDCTVPPGVLALYPKLEETPLRKPEQRTIWNVRDADATLIIYPEGSRRSSGTGLTEKTAGNLGKPCFVIRREEDIPDAAEWLDSLGDELILNVAGPRESECAGVYEKAVIVLREILRCCSED